jgi:hypothetical protein
MKFTLERYYFYKDSKEKIEMNDNNIDVYNPIFESLHSIKQKYVLSPHPPTLPPLPKPPPKHYKYEAAVYT